MFAKLHVRDFSEYGLNYSASYNSRIQEFKQRNKDIFVKVEDYLLNGYNTLSASQIESSLFPSFEADVFISHSHKDEDDVIRLALMLEDMGLDVFVDSCYWGYAGDLQKKIDDKFCRIIGSSTSYDYQSVLHTSANINNVLTSALHGMIDKAELFLFLGTENSVLLSDEFSGKEKLTSPWISSELLFADRVRRTKKRIRPSLEANAMDSAVNEEIELRKSVEFIYDFPELQSLSWVDFYNWICSYKIENSTRFYEFHKKLSGLNHLDILYKLMNIDEKKNKLDKLLLG